MGKKVNPILADRKAYDAVMENKRKRKQIKAMARTKCTHRKKGGSFDTEFVDEPNGVVKCRICGTTFTLRRITKSEYRMARDILYGMCEQIRSQCGPDSLDTMQALTKVEIQLAEIWKSYKHLFGKSDFDKYNKKGKGKRKQYSNNVIIGEQRISKFY